MINPYRAAISFISLFVAVSTQNHWIPLIDQIVVRDDIEVAARRAYHVMLRSDNPTEVAEQLAELHRQFALSREQVILGPYLRQLSEFSEKRQKVVQKLDCAILYKLNETTLKKQNKESICGYEFNELEREADISLMYGSPNWQHGLKALKKQVDQNWNSFQLSSEEQVCLSSLPMFESPTEARTWLILGKLGLYKSHPILDENGQPYPAATAGLRAPIACGDLEVGTPPISESHLDDFIQVAYLMDEKAYREKELDDHFRASTSSLRESSIGSLQVSEEVDSGELFKSLTSIPDNFRQSCAQEIGLIRKLFYEAKNDRRNRFRKNRPMNPKFDHLVEKQVQYVRDECDMRITLLQ